ncbi:HAD family hydrolase [Kocuria palustris]|uniref:HAD family hydrolase n=1 Tax=Kocuria palustris TaxID=71999 RepID=UPI003D7227A5
MYDLDGVLTTRDSFTALVIEQLRRAPLRLMRALPAAAVMLVSGREQRKRQAAARVAAIALRGMSDDEYTALATGFGTRIGGDRAWIRIDTVERIRRQSAQGVRIVIATATEQRLAQALLAQAGVPYDLLSASVLTQTASGMEVSDHRVGDRKTDALREQCVPIEQAEFVTDSMTDLPTARAAARVVLIGASQKTRERYGQAGVSITDPAPPQQVN